MFVEAMLTLVHAHEHAQDETKLDEKVRKQRKQRLSIALRSDLKKKLFMSWKYGSVMRISRRRCGSWQVTGTWL